MGNRTIVLGGGEIGRALAIVLAQYKPKVVDKDSSRSQGHIARRETFDIMHVAIPWSGEFESEVKAAQELYRVKYTVIHSTVEPGVSRRLGCVYSPIVGIHPQLVECIKKFPKYLAGKDASAVADYFRRCGVRIKLMENSDALEFAKLKQLQFYGLQIAFVKHLATVCKKKGYNFSETFSIPARDYNENYAAMGLPYCFPLLEPIMTPIGGHCVTQHLDLIKDGWSQVIKRCEKDLID